MERLQEALSRARERRAQVPQTSDQTSAPMRPPVPASGATSVQQAWQNLSQYTPNERLLRNNRVLSYFGQKDAAPFDMLRTKIVQLAKTNNWRRIVITSPNPRCGKTTLVANLAFSLARQADLRTIVVEVDMRRPELAHMLGIQGEQSFARALSGQEAAANHMVAFGNNLAFASNQSPVSNPSELLQSATARATLEKLEMDFAPDVILFDAAPMQGSDDTVGFLDFVDAVIIVAAAEVTTVSQIDVIETEIAAITNVLGVVLNKSRINSSGKSYDYSYT